MTDSDLSGKPRRFRTSHFISAAVALICCALLIVVVTRRAPRFDRPGFELANYPYDWNRSWLANQRLRREALHAKAAEIVPKLRRQLHYDPKTRKWFERARFWVSQRFELEVGRARTPAWMVREETAQALAQFGPDAQAALPDLLECTRDSEPMVRAAAAQAIGSIGVGSVEAISALNGLLNQRHSEIVTSAAYALWRLQPDNAIARDRLIASLSRHNVRRVAESLAENGAAARAFAPALRQWMASKTGYEDQVCVARAIWKITGDLEPALQLAETLVREIRSGGLGPNPVIDVIKAENGLATAVLYLSESSEFRSKVRPDLVRWSKETENPRRSRWAQDLVRRLDIAEVEEKQAR